MNSSGQPVHCGFDGGNKAYHGVAKPQSHLPSSDVRCKRDMVAMKEVEAKGGEVKDQDQRL